jgi:hypothetical protein
MQHSRAHGTAKAMQCRGRRYSALLYTSLANLLASLTTTKATTVRRDIAGSVAAVASDPKRLSDVSVEEAKLITCCTCTYASSIGPYIHLNNLVISGSSLHRYLELAMQCSNRTIPEAIDALSVEHPERVWARYFANSNDFGDGIYRSVTFESLARAIDFLARLLHTKIPTLPMGSTILYIGPSDIRYFILACAACKCNFKVSTNENCCQSDTDRETTGAPLFAQERCRSTLFTGPRNKM